MGRNDTSYRSRIPLGRRSIGSMAKDNQDILKIPMRRDDLHCSNNMELRATSTITPCMETPTQRPARDCRDLHILLATL